MYYSSVDIYAEHLAAGATVSERWAVNDVIQWMQDSFQKINDLSTWKINI